MQKRRPDDNDDDLISNVDEDGPLFNFTGKLRKHRRELLVGALAFAVVLAAFGAWPTVKALDAKSNLEQARQSAQQAKDALLPGQDGRGVSVCRFRSSCPRNKRTMLRTPCRGTSHRSFPGWVALSPRANRSPMSCSAWPPTCYSRSPGRSGYLTGSAVRERQGGRRDSAPGGSPARRDIGSCNTTPAAQLAQSLIRGMCHCSATHGRSCKSKLQK